MSEPIGVALLCDRAGMVREVLHAEPELLDARRPPFAATSLWESGSVPKWFELLRRLEDGAPVNGWELVGRNAQDGLVSLEVAAACADETDDMLIVAVPLGRSASDFLDLLDRGSSDWSGPLEQLRRHGRRGSAPPPDMPALHNEMMALQRTLAKQNATLERLHHEKNLLLGMLAHDLRSPLNAIVLTATALVEARSLPEQRRERLLKSISSSASYLADLVNDMLDLSVIESGEVQLRPQPIDLVGLVRKVIELNEMLAERRGIRLESRLPPEPKVGEVDPAKVEQVVANLVSNAIKFSPDGSVVVVSLTMDAAGVATLSVEDQGQGIPSDRLKDIFRPFGVSGSTLHEGDTSTGLGLAIVKRIVERHRGSIEVDSVPGEGSVFRVRLPVRRDAGNA